MNVKSVERNGNQATIVVEIDKELMERGVNSAYMKARKSIMIPGFRKGKAPRKMIEAMYGAHVFYEDGLEEIFPEIYEFAVASQDGFKAIGRPSLTDMQIADDNTVTLTLTTDVYPEVTLGQYKGLEVEKAEPTVTDAQVQAELDAMAKNVASTENVDRPAEMGDTANIDFEGFDNGVPFEGGKGENFDLTLGSHSYIDDFEDQIVGHMPGESFDVTVTFPEDYGNENLNGKEAVFKTTLNYIKESKNPDLTDDWVASNLGETMNLNTIDELNDFVKNTMLYDQQASTVYSALHDKVSFAKELPQSVLDYYRDVVLYRVYSYAKNYGTTMTTLLKSGVLGTSYDSIDAYLEDIQGSLNTITEQALLMQAIAEKQGLVCDTALMNQDFGKFYGTTDPSAYISSYGENYIKMNVLQSEVMQGLIDNIKYK